VILSAGYWDYGFGGQSINQLPTGGCNICRTTARAFPVARAIAQVMPRFAAFASILDGVLRPFPHAAPAGEVNYLDDPRDTLSVFDCRVERPKNTRPQLIPVVVDYDGCVHGCPFLLLTKYA
jgi:hypothetical protein